CPFVYYSIRVSLILIIVHNDSDRSLISANVHHLCAPHARPGKLHSFPTRRSSDLPADQLAHQRAGEQGEQTVQAIPFAAHAGVRSEEQRLNSSHVKISYAVFCLKKKKSATSNRSTYSA